MNDTSAWISFNDYFDKKKIYRHHFYNRDFAQKSQSAEQKYSDENIDDEIEIIYFKGINSSDGLKKRYKELMKMYHPDNQYGDNDVCLIVQREYDYLLQKFGE